MTSLSLQNLNFVEANILTLPYTGDSATNKNHLHIADGLNLPRTAGKQATRQKRPTLCNFYEFTPVIALISLFYFDKNMK